MDRRLRAVLIAGLASAAIGTQALAQPPFPPIPPPRYEAVPPPPGARVLWEPGHWQWNGGQYVWVGGRYVERRPHYGQYIPGRWVPRGGAWVWEPAHWR